MKWSRSHLLMHICLYSPVDFQHFYAYFMLNYSITNPKHGANSIYNMRSVYFSSLLQFCVPLVVLKQGCLSLCDCQSLTELSEPRHHHAWLCCCSNESGNFKGTHGCRVPCGSPQSALLSCSRPISLFFPCFLWVMCCYWVMHFIKCHGSCLTTSSSEEARY